MNNFLLALSMVILSSIFSSFADLFLKEGSGNILNFRLLWRDHKLLLGILLSAVSFLPFVIALHFADLSLAYPLKALSFVWVIILSKIYLNESIDKEKVIASLLIVAGVILLSLSA